MVGVENVFVNIEGYKLVSDEVVIVVVFDIILMMMGVGDYVVSDDVVFVLLVIVEMLVGKVKWIVWMDGMYFFGFGFCIVDVIVLLYEVFYG